MCPILNQNLRYYVICSSVILHHYRRVYIYIRITIYIYTYISATPQTRRMKVLHCNGYIIFFFHHITSLQKDLNLPPPPNNTYKGLLMVIFYLIENTSGAKGPLSPRKPRIRENQKFTSRTLPRLRGGLLKNSGLFTRKKHRLRANVRICANSWLCPETSSLLRNTSLIRLMMTSRWNGVSFGQTNSNGGIVSCANSSGCPGAFWDILDGIGRPSR